MAGTSFISGELSEGGGPYDGSTGPMGPCLAVNPGQTLTVQVKNRMDEGMKKLGQTGTDLHRYWELAKEGPDSAPAGVASGVLDDIRIPPWMTDSDSTGWFGSPPKSAEDMIVTNIQVRCHTTHVVCTCACTWCCMLYVTTAQRDQEYV